MATPAVTRGFRADIQGLRAVAVSLVLLYHLWPDRMPGGFIGVDVFFVISGFLITSHLYARPPRSWDDLTAFWGRRVRRLLPASLLVLVVTLIATRIVAPETQWARTAHGIMAAALYVQNWELARSSVDYLAAENVASPVQHFWSLSVEEQFYLVWPVLLLLLVALGLRLHWRRGAVVGVGLGAVVTASFISSVHATTVEPASAYFVTPTRIWELGIGALLALAVATRGPDRLRWNPWVRTALAWLGIALIAATAFLYTSATPFPGWQAGIPVLGTAFVIAARAEPIGASPIRALALRPVQFVGDISYSLYLWHWPLVILLPYVIGNLGGLDKLTILVVTTVLAWLTKRYVEDKFRVAVSHVSLKRTFVMTAAVMATVMALSGAQILEVGLREKADRAELVQAVADSGSCFGAAALNPPTGRCESDTQGPSLPSPAQAVDDKSEAYDQGCFEPAPFKGVRRCVFGDPKGEVSIALVGNSHAGHWLPALQKIATKRGWKVTTFLASECSISATPVVWDTAAKQSGCLEWADKVLAQTSKGFDVVVTSERNGRAAAGQSFASSYPSWLAGYQRVVAGWQKARTNVVVIHDTATPGATLKSVPDCIALNQDDLQNCAGPRSRWVPKDPLIEAARAIKSKRISTVDLNDYLCDGDTCPPVVGGVTVYSDASHLTKTFAATLAPFVEPALTRAVKRSQRG